MKLYHGTSTKYLDSILEQGLLPRDISGVATRHRYKEGKEWLESAPGVVYLGKFGVVHACITPQKDNVNGENHSPVLIEIDLANLDESRFVPDEDYAAVALMAERRELPVGSVVSAHSLEEAERFDEELRANQLSLVADITKVQHMWRESLEYLGFLGHLGRIAPSQFSKVVTMPLDKSQFETFYELVSAAHNADWKKGKRLGDTPAMTRTYEPLTRWFMGATVNADDMQTFTHRFEPGFRRQVNRMLRRSPIVNLTRGGVLNAV